MKEATPAQRQQIKWAESDQAELNKFVNAAMGTREGRRYLLWLLTIGKVGAQPFATNALTTSFNCGELNVGNQILAHILNVNPAGYVQMMKERDDERSTRSNHLNNLTRSKLGQPTDDYGARDDHDGEAGS